MIENSTDLYTQLYFSLTILNNHINVNDPDIKNKSDHCSLKVVLRILIRSGPSHVRLPGPALSKPSHNS